MASKKAIASGFNGVPGDYVKDHHVAVRYLRNGDTYKEGFAPLRKVGGKLAVKLGGRLIEARLEDGVAVADADGKPLAATPKVFSKKHGKMVTDVAAVNTSFPGIETPPSGFLTYAQFAAASAPKGRKAAAPAKAAPAKGRKPSAAAAPNIDDLVAMLATDEKLKAAFIAKLIG